MSVLWIWWRKVPLRAYNTVSVISCRYFKNTVVAAKSEQQPVRSTKWTQHANSQSHFALSVTVKLKRSLYTFLVLSSKTGKREKRSKLLKAPGFPSLVWPFTSAWKVRLPHRPSAFPDPAVCHSDNNKESPKNLCFQQTLPPFSWLTQPNQSVTNIEKWSIFKHKEETQ